MNNNVNKPIAKHFEVILCYLVVTSSCDSYINVQYFTSKFPEVNEETPELQVANFLPYQSSHAV
jgi:hypothetical protein